MVQEAKSPGEEGAQAVEVEPRADIYDLHIKVPEVMRDQLKDAAELAYKLEQIPKPELVELMNLFISWGMTVLKKQWLDRIGYR